MAQGFLKDFNVALLTGGLTFFLLALGAMVVAIIVSDALRRAVFTIATWVIIIATLLALGGLLYQVVKGEFFASFNWAYIILPLAIMTVVGIILLTAVFLAFRVLPPRFKHSIHPYTRQQYLKRVIKSYHDSTLLPLWFKHLKISKDLLENNVLILGVSGIGKTSLLKQITVWLAQATLSKKEHYIPVYIDLGLAFASNHPLSSPRTSMLHPQIGGPLLIDEILSLEADEGNLCFVLDLSAANSLHWRKSELVQTLDSFIRRYGNCRFILALPPQFEGCSFLAHFTIKHTLDGLTNELIKQFCLAKIGTQAEQLYTGLLKNSTWLSLSRRPFLLNRLVQYFNLTQQIPSDLVNLFQTTLYRTGSKTVDGFDNLLSETANQIVQLRISSLATREVKRHLEKNNKQIPVNFKLLSKSLRSNPPIKTWFDVQYLQTMIQFRHSLFISYFLALGWHTGVIPFVFNFIADEFNGEAQTLLLNEALIFFSTLEIDSARVDSQIFKVANRGDALSLILAATCFTARPEAARSISLGQRICEQLVSQLVADQQSFLQQLWLLLMNWKLEERVLAYREVLSQVGPVRQELALERIGTRSFIDVAAIFRLADEKLSLNAGLALIRLDPTQALAEFVEVYHNDSDTKRKLAIAMMGAMPQSSEVANALLAALQEEQSSELQIGILKSLQRLGLESTIALISIVASDVHDVAVRVCAAKILRGSANLDLRTEEAIESIMRSLRGQIPKEVKEPLGQLLAQLREIVPEVVERVEISLNPYVVGKPVDDRHMFFGRDEILLELKNAVRSGNNFLIFGERRIGKSSILQQLLLHLQSERQAGEPYAPIYITLEGLSQQEFYARVIKEILDRGGIPGLGCEDQLEDHQYTYWDFNKDLGQIIQALKSACGKEAKLVLLLDEVDVMITYPQQMHSLLRRTFGSDYKDNLVVILAGVDPVRKWERVESPFYNLFTWRKITPLPYDAALSLIILPVAGTCDYAPEAVDLILEYSACKPFEIQGICQQVINHVLLQGRRQITVEDVRRVYEAQHLLYKQFLADVESNVKSIFLWAEQQPEATAAERTAQIQILLTWLSEALEDRLAKLERQQIPEK